MTNVSYATNSVHPSFIPSIRALFRLISHVHLEKKHLRLKTNVSGDKCVGAQTCLGTNECGHKRVWAQMSAGTNVSGYKCV